MRSGMAKVARLAPGRAPTSGALRGMRALTLGALLAAGVLGQPTPGAAQGVPVFDASNVAQAIEQVRQGVEMIERAQQQINALTGARGMSLLLNSAEDIAGRAAAENFPDLVSGAVTGGEILGNTTRIVAAIDRIKRDFELNGLSEFSTSPFAQYRSLASLGGASLAAMATGEDSYARANATVTRVNTMIAQIDTTPDLKASVDLNTRVQLENTMLLTELIRLQSSQANAEGARSLFETRQEMASRGFVRGIGEAGGTP